MRREGKEGPLTFAQLERGREEGGDGLSFERHQVTKDELTFSRFSSGRMYV